MQKLFNLMKVDPAFITRSTLALLQEEAGDPSKKRDWRCTDAPLVPQWAPKGAYPLPPPPGVDKPQAVAANKPCSGPKPLDRRLADLKAYRRAHGLCDHCGEKWSRDHKRAPKSVSMC